MQWSGRQRRKQYRARCPEAEEGKPEKEMVIRVKQSERQAQERKDPVKVS